MDFCSNTFAVQGNIMLYLEQKIHRKNEVSRFSEKLRKFSPCSKTFLAQFTVDQYGVELKLKLIPNQK